MKSNLYKFLILFLLLCSCKSNNAVKKGLIKVNEVYFKETFCNNLNLNDTAFVFRFTRPGSEYFIVRKTSMSSNYDSILFVKCINYTNRKMHYYKRRIVLIEKRTNFYYKSLVDLEKNRIYLDTIFNVRTSEDGKYSYQRIENELTAHFQIKILTGKIEYSWDNKTLTLHTVLQHLDERFKYVLLETMYEIAYDVVW